MTQEPPFRAGAGRGARHRPYPDSHKKPGKSSAASSTRQRWRVPGGGSPGRLCPALAESAGQLPGHRHCRGRGGHCIPAETSTHPSVHQLPDQEQPSRPSASLRCLAVEGSHRAGHQRDIPRILQPAVPGPKEDRRSAACDRSLHPQPPHGSSTLQDGDARVRPFSHQKSGVDSIDRHPRCLPSCSDAPGRPQVSTLRGQQASLPVHLPPFRVSGITPGVHQAAAARRSAVKAARCEATRLLRRLADQSRYSRTGQTARPDDHQGTPVSRMNHQLWEVRPPPSQDFQFIGMQFNTWQFTVAPLPKMRLKVQAVHQHWMTNPNMTARDLQRLLGMLVFMALLVQRGRLRLRPVQWLAVTSWCQTTRSWSNRITVPQWVLSEVAWWASPAVMRGLPLAAKETEVTLFTDASSSGWGAQLGSRSTRGQWSAPQRSWHINALEMQAIINAVRDFLPHLRSRVVRLMCDNAVTVAYIKNEGGTRSYTLMQLTLRLLKWCDRKVITLVPVHQPGVHNVQADSLSRVGQTLNTEWTRAMAMERLQPMFAKWGEPQVDLFATFANRRLIKFVSPYADPRAEWTDAMSMPWDNGWGLLYAFPPFKMVPQVLQKIAQYQESGWFWSLNCNRQRRGFRSWWICPKKIRSRCPSKAKTCWLKTFWQATGWLRLFTSGRQIYARGNSSGHPEGLGPFQGSCQHDVKVPTWIITPSVRITLVQIRGIL